MTDIVRSFMSDGINLCLSFVLESNMQSDATLTVSFKSEKLESVENVVLYSDEVNPSPSKMCDFIQS